MLEVSQAPDGRLNLKYDIAGKTNEVRELPLRFMVVGNYAGDREVAPIERREPVEVHQGNLDEVMGKLRPMVIAEKVRDVFAMPRKDQPAPETPPLELEFRTLADFHPDNLLRQLTEAKRDPKTQQVVTPPKLEVLAQQLKLREALMALRGPMGNLATFRKEMETVIQNEEKRATLERVLGFNR